MTHPLTGRNKSAREVPAAGVWVDLTAVVPNRRKEKDFQATAEFRSMLNAMSLGPEDDVVEWPRLEGEDHGLEPRILVYRDDAMATIDDRFVSITMGMRVPASELSRAEWCAQRVFDALRARFTRFAELVHLARGFLAVDARPVTLPEVMGWCGEYVVFRNNSSWRWVGEYAPYDFRREDGCHVEVKAGDGRLPDWAWFSVAEIREAVGQPRYELVGVSVPGEVSRRMVDIIKLAKNDKTAGMPKTRSRTRSHRPPHEDVVRLMAQFGRSAAALERPHVEELESLLDELRPAHHRSYDNPFATGAYLHDLRPVAKLAVSGRIKVSLTT
ncbi:MAG: hypothetical protein HY904_24070 [Deltaproteobacteria bacterium]|nr:hypothetical protein [Deltaproteobacteria bacterium]